MAKITSPGARSQTSVPTIGPPHHRGAVLAQCALTALIGGCYRTCTALLRRGGRDLWMLGLGFALFVRAAPCGALLLGGDFNLDEKEPRDRAVLDHLIRELGLTNSKAVAARADGWGRHDCLFYRSGPRTHLHVLEAGEAPEFTLNGVPLSDHPALWLRLRVMAH